jgi:hypothetical protein
MPLNRPSAIALLALGTCFPASLAAQWPADLVSGARVRARLPEVQYQMDGVRGHLIRGRVTALSGDTLYLAVTDSLGPLAIPRSLIQRLDVSRGVPSRGLSALQRGVLSGALGALTGLLVFGIDDEPDGIVAGEAALVYGGVSLALGGVLGALFPHERWKRVRLGG